MSAPQDNNRIPQKGSIIGSSGPVVTPTNSDWIGFVTDFIPIFIVAAAYAISAQIIPFGGGSVNASAVQEPLFYTLSISLGGAAFGLVLGWVLALVMSSITQQETDQQFLFFTVFPLAPVLALLAQLLFGLSSTAGGTLLGAILAACAVTPILLAFMRDTNRSPRPFIDAAFVSYFCALSAELTRETLGSAGGLGNFAAKAMYSFDTQSTFFVLFVLALITSALALLRRFAQMTAASRQP